VIRRRQLRRAQDLGDRDGGHGREAGTRFRGLERRKRRVAAGGRSAARLRRFWPVIAETKTMAFPEGSCVIRRRRDGLYSSRGVSRAEADRRDAGGWELVGRRQQVPRSFSRASSRAGFVQPRPLQRFLRQLVEGWCRHDGPARASCCFQPRADPRGDRFEPALQALMRRKTQAVAAGLETLLLEDRRRGQRVLHLSGSYSLGRSVRFESRRK